MILIQAIHSREILDSRGSPTLEVDVRLSDGTTARAAVPSGASTGSNEAVELRDHDPHRFGGKGVLKAVNNVNMEIAPALIGKSAEDQTVVDDILRAIDHTSDKSNMGANALLGVSLAVARAMAFSSHTPLYQRLCLTNPILLPVPMFNVLNGGVHSDNNVDFQEFMIAPVGAASFRDALRMGEETYQVLKKVLKNSGHSVAVGDEGGFAPRLKENEEAVEVILKAIVKAGFKAGKDIVICLDPASSEFYSEGKYRFSKSDDSERTSEQMIVLYEDWARQYPIWSLEDGLAENDWRGWKLLTERLGKKIQLVGDDIFVTNPTIIHRAVTEGIANAALIKLNQIGTLSETLTAVQAARDGNFGIVISHRSGETADDFIADLAVGVAAGQIKTGAPARGERVAKYNQLLRIEEELGSEAKYAGLEYAARGGFIHA